MILEQKAETEAAPAGRMAAEPRAPPAETQEHHPANGGSGPFLPTQMKDKKGVNTV